MLADHWCSSALRCPRRQSCSPESRRPLPEIEAPPWSPGGAGVSRLGLLARRTSPTSRASPLRVICSHSVHLPVRGPGVAGIRVAPTKNVLKKKRRSAKRPPRRFTLFIPPAASSARATTCAANGALSLKRRSRVSSRKNCSWGGTRRRVLVPAVLFPEASRRPRARRPAGAAPRSAHRTPLECAPVERGWHHCEGGLGSGDNFFWPDLHTGSIGG